MNSAPGEKRFDCVKRTREVRDRINEEVADMPGAELAIRNPKELTNDG